MNNAPNSRVASVVRWWTSRTVRQASELRRQVRRLVNEQRDLLNPAAVESITRADRHLEERMASTTNAEDIKQAMAALESAANEGLLPYPHGALRENIKELLVAVAVIFGFTTFFLQLTKIPTNSLVPTLYGITSQDLRNDPNLQIPGRLTRFVQSWTRGILYYHQTALSAGILNEVEPARLVLPFIKKQRFRIGGTWYEVWLPPDRFEERAGLHPGRKFRAGEDIFKLKVVSGDHLLVDRFTYNFRRPQRGEIFVFKTRGIPGLPEGQLYIKRLVALGGEHVRIGNDQHLIINGQRLDSSTPHFEKVYSFFGGPKDEKYLGHVNEIVANRYGRSGLARLFRDETCEYVVGPHAYLAMGDNTMNSFDSRAWGDVPRQNVIGKCWFVYWPFTGRFGWGTR